MLFLFFVFFLISSAFLVNKYITFFLSPDLFVALRMGISGILLFLIYSFNKDTIKQARENIMSIILIAIFTTFFPSLLRAYALKFIPASRSAFWGALEPFIASLWMYILYRQSMNRYQIAGCFISFFALYFFVFMQYKESLFGDILFCIADMVQIGSLFISRFGWIRGQELLQKNIFSPQQLNSFSFIISGCLSLISFFIRGGSLMTYSHLLMNMNFILAMLYTIIIGNMIAYGLYAYVLKNTIVTYVSIAGLSMPLFVHILSFFFFNEALSFSFFLSLLLIAIALFVFQLKDSL